MLETSSWNSDSATVMGSWSSFWSWNYGAGLLAGREESYNGSRTCRSERRGSYDTYVCVMWVGVVTTIVDHGRRNSLRRRGRTRSLWSCDRALVCVSEVDRASNRLTHSYEDYIICEECEFQEMDWPCVCPVRLCWPIGSLDNVSLLLWWN